MLLKAINDITASSAVFTMTAANPTHHWERWVRLGLVLPVVVWKNGVLTLAGVGVGVERWKTERSAENDRLLS